MTTVVSMLAAYCESQSTTDPLSGLHTRRGFEEAIAGCYARVNVGPNRDTGLNQYRLCLIKSKTPPDSRRIHG